MAPSKQHTLKDAMSESEEIMYTIVDDLLKRTGTHPHEVSIRN